MRRLSVTPETVISADIDESSGKYEPPREYAKRMAREKARAAYSLIADAENAHVLAGDTVVAVGRRILPKAENSDQARACLKLLSGRRHRVYSAIALREPDGTMREKLSETIVKFKCLTPQEIADYISGGEWEGKAGGYAIQGAAEGLITEITGSHSGVMGLPLYETRAVLKAAGFPIK